MKNNTKGPKWLATKKRAKGDPAALQLAGERPRDFVGEEAPEARAGPRSPDVFIGARRPERP